MSKSNNKKKIKIVAIIPARGGSKGIPKKNIKLLGGYPLIAYSIIAAKFTPQIERTIISTDSREIADVSLSFGGEIPFLRPAGLAGDNSPDKEFIMHFLNWFKENEGYYPGYVVHLRPTTPLREPALIEQAIQKIIKHDNATSLRSVHETQESPYKLFGIKDEFLESLFPEDPRPEYYNLPRQAFPPVYHPNGYIDIIKTETVMKKKSLHGPNILSFVTPVTVEVDRPEDFEHIELILTRKKSEIYEYLKNNFKEKSESLNVRS